jgi:DNA invertase Pin-like site-specific DNA recombinase
MSTPQERSIKAGRLIPAAQYVRMSTDHQRYSTENQRDAIQAYADKHGMTIVQTYADEGKSGLSLEGRAALKRLIADVQAATRPKFEAILVYDISRWGRFQDADESAYYEYLCRRAGIQVVYCAEPFDNDGNPMAVIVKSVKRVMAGEYSRELSNKVFMGQCRLIELGFRQGGAAGFGLRRVLLDERRQPKGELHRGERKSLQTDRVILVPGPDEETSTVRKIYERFVREGKGEQEIADELNAAGVLTDLGRAWTRGTVHQVLINEKYVGNNVYNRTSFKLKMKHVRNTPNMWVRRNGAFEPVVSLELFSDANERIAARSRRFDDETMLGMLRGLYDRVGSLSGLLIDEQEGFPSSNCFRTRFGGLLRAYSLIGFQPVRDYRYLAVNRLLRQRLPEILARVVGEIGSAGGQVARNERTDLLTLNDELTLSITIARCLRTPGGAYRWRIRFDASLQPDITIAVRMAANESDILDYYIFPHIDRPLRPVRVAEENNDVCFDAYRFETLDPFYELVERVPLSAVA